MVISLLDEILRYEMTDRWSIAGAPRRVQAHKVVLREQGVVPQYKWLCLIHVGHSDGKKFQRKMWDYQDVLPW